MESYLEILKVITKDQDYVKNAFERLKNVAEDAENYEDVFFRLPDSNQDLVWLQLIDDLIENNYAFETDWKEDYTEVKTQIENLFQKKAILQTIEHDGDFFDLEAEDYFPRINQLLSEANFSLVCLDIDSDSYITALIDKNKIQILLSLDDRIKIY